MGSGNRLPLSDPSTHLSHRKITVLHKRKEYTHFSQISECLSVRTVLPGR